MYRDLLPDYWWPCMKRDVAWYVDRCLTCRKVKAKHQWPHVKIESLDAPVWKWEEITMDFITKLPWIMCEVDSIWVIMDRMTKSAPFIPIQERIYAEKLEYIHIREVEARHGVPVYVLFDRDVRLTSRFWILAVVGIRTSLWRSFRIKTVIMPTLINLLLRYSVGGGAEP